MNGNDSPLISTNRQHELGTIRYVYDGIESTIQYSLANLSNTSTLYYGDKVEFSKTPGIKFASNITLIERNRIRGWVAIVREGKGFLEQNNSTEPIAFTGDSTQIELGDEVEFSLRKISGRLTAENILKVSSTITNFYVSSIF